MSNSPFWNDDWMRTQQKYWDQWTEMSQKAMGANAFGQKPAGNPWESALDHWWKAISPAAPDASRGFIEKMMDQGKVFFRMNEEMSNNLSKAQGWSDALSQTFEKMQDGFASGAEQSADAAEKGYGQWMGMWEGPMESWRKAAGSLPMNSDFAHIPNMFEKLMGMPGLGFTREDEESYKELGESWTHYQHALMSYNHFFSDLGSASVRCMKDKVRDLVDKGEKIDSGRALYDTWVAACEEEYAKHTMTPEYSKVHGELVNALMAFKKKWRELTDNRLGMMGLPTTREVRTLQTRLQESRREMRSLRSEMELLKEQVTSLRAPAPAKAPAAAPAATRKKAAVKKTTTRKTAKKKVVAKKTTAK